MIEKFLNEIPNFVNPLLEHLNRLGIIAFVGQVDHICLRVSSNHEYEHFRGQLLNISTLLSESSINGRLIATFKLPTPIAVGYKHQIDVVELPSPKSGSSYRLGFEHIEVVTTIKLEELLKRYSSTLRFDTKNLDLKRNRDVNVTFPEGLVKFHESSLERIIAEETAAAILMVKH